MLSTFIPAGSTQLSLNGRFATGAPWCEQRGDHASSSAVPARSESWLRPRD